MNNVHALVRTVDRVELDDAAAIVRLLSTEIQLSGQRLQDIAKRAGLSPQTVGRIYCRDTKQPQPRTIIKLLNHFGYRLVAEGKG